ncbi:hypothetical protein ACB092_09G121800 [Castanea dentata]
MATQAVYFKEHEGIVHNSMGQLPSSWWGSFASQSGYGESCGQLKSFSMDLPSGGDQLIANKQAGRGTEHGAERGNTTQFTIFPDNCKSSGDGQKPQATISLQSSLSAYRGRFELGFSQPMICAKYPYVDQCYGVFPNCGPQISPYMHESRHLHAKRRPRGCGGRFLNTKNTNKEKSGTEVIKTGDGQLSQGTGSQSSEVLQSDSGTFISSKDAKGSGSNISGSGVTSMFCRGDLDRFQINHLMPPAHPFADLIDGGRGLVMPKWVTAPDNCCNLTV